MSIFRTKNLDTMVADARAPGGLKKVLGPLDLDLLGLQVHLDTVHLNITARSGPGELVGNLLCAIANLLNGGLPLNTVLGQIAALLNQLLAILG